MGLRAREVGRGREGGRGRLDTCMGGFQNFLKISIRRFNYVFGILLRLILMQCYYSVSNPFNWVILCKSYFKGAF